MSTIRMLRMSPSVDPIDVGSFGAQQIMAQAYLGPHLVQQPGLFSWDCRLAARQFWVWIFARR